MKKIFKVLVIMIVLLLVGKVNAATFEEFIRASSSKEYIAVYLGDVNHDGQVTKYNLSEGSCVNDNDLTFDDCMLLGATEGTPYGVVLTNAEKIAGNASIYKNGDNAVDSSDIDLVRAWAIKASGGQLGAKHIVFIPADTAGASAYLISNSELNTKLLYKKITNSQFKANNVVKVYRGDASMDGTLNGIDSVLMHRVENGTYASPWLTQAQSNVSDFDGDGVLTSHDIDLEINESDNKPEEEWLTIEIPMNVYGAQLYLLNDTTLNGAGLYKRVAKTNPTPDPTPDPDPVCEGDECDHGAVVTAFDLLINELEDMSISFTRVNDTLKILTKVNDEGDDEYAIFKYADGVLTYVSQPLTKEQAKSHHTAIYTVLEAFARSKGYNVNNFFWWLYSVDAFSFDKDGILLDSEEDKTTPKTFKIDLENVSKTFEKSEYNTKEEIVIDDEKDTKDEKVTNPKTAALGVGLGILVVGGIGTGLYFYLRKKEKFMRL